VLSYYERLIDERRVIHREEAELEDGAALHAERRALEV
jgi:hypothetical protein